jgi:hypothetical protein
MYRFACNNGFDVEELRTRLRKMNDEDLLRFGKAARFMCRDKSPLQVQLEEARAEWCRHPTFRNGLIAFCHPQAAKIGGDGLLLSPTVTVLYYDIVC